MCTIHVSSSRYTALEQPENANRAEHLSKKFEKVVQTKAGL